MFFWHLFPVSVLADIENTCQTQETRNERERGRKREKERETDTNSIWLYLLILSSFWMVIEKKTRQIRKWRVGKGEGEGEGNTGSLEQHENCIFLLALHHEMNTERERNIAFDWLELRHCHALYWGERRLTSISFNQLWLCTCFLNLSLLSSFHPILNIFPLAFPILYFIGISFVFDSLEPCFKHRTRVHPLPAKNKTKPVKAEFCSSKMASELANVKGKTLPLILCVVHLSNTGRLTFTPSCTLQYCSNPLLIKLQK